MSSKVNLSPILVGRGLPNFNEITANDINSNLPILLEELNNDLSSLEKDLSVKQILTWDELIKPIYKIEERLRWSWGVVSHLNGVSNTPELRNAHASQQTHIVRFSHRLGQSNILFKMRPEFFLTTLCRHKQNL